MAALGHTSTPFCFVIQQLLGFFPGQVHLSEVPFDDIYPVLPRSYWLSLVTSQFPVCCLTSCSRVVHSQDILIHSPNTISQLRETLPMGKVLRSSIVAFPPSVNSVLVFEFSFRFNFPVLVSVSGFLTLQFQLSFS